MDGPGQKGEGHAACQGGHLSSTRTWSWETDDRVQTDRDWLPTPAEMGVLRRKLADLWKIWREKKEILQILQNLQVNSETGI